MLFRERNNPFNAPQIPCGLTVIFLSHKTKYVINNKQLIYCEI